MAFLVVKRADAEDLGKIFDLDRPSVIIGRRTSQYIPDIELNDEIVSRRHAEIVHQGDKYLLRDLNSTNGTMLDDDRILPDKLCDLKDNSKIGLGVEGDSSHIVLLFKMSESTNIIQGKGSHVVKPDSAHTVTWLKIDERKKDVRVDGKPVRLSKKEYELMVFLYSNTGKICSRDEIISAVWPESKDPSAISDATIDQLIHRLREKVEPEPSRPSRIVSKKAFGYMLV